MEMLQILRELVRIGRPHQPGNCSAQFLTLIPLDFFLEIARAPFEPRRSTCKRRK
jgi:hypothetical protein